MKQKIVCPYCREEKDYYDSNIIKGPFFYKMCKCKSCGEYIYFEVIQGIFKSILFVFVIFGLIKLLT